MKIYRSLTTVILLGIAMMASFAQDVIVTVTPVQQVLPPQVLLYIADPGKYFTITLTNVSEETQNVYLGMDLQQTMPASDLAISTPPNRQPKQPFTIQPKSTYQLNMVEMKKLFDHIPANEIQCPPGLFDNYMNGSFGLLPEGLYTAKVTAYKWSYPPYAAPVVASSPTGGSCTFTVCYKAQAPQFLMPMITALDQNDVAKVDVLNAQFTWTMPTITCGSKFANYVYDFRVVELFEGQQPDVAMDRNPVVYQVTDLLSNMCLIPVNIITNRFYADKKYVAQVIAKQKNASMLDYVMLENEGKSTYRIFELKTTEEQKQDNVPEPADPTEQDKEEQEEQDDQEEETDEEENEGSDESGVDPMILWGLTGVQDSTYDEGLYNFRNPKLITPSFSEFGARKFLLGSDIGVTWDEVWHLGGVGQQPDTLTFDYEVQLFNGKNIIDREEVLKTTPIYANIIKGTEELTDTIPWELIGEDISDKDYIVLRVKPVCTNAPDSAITFHHDSLNVIDFALVESMAKKYFQCSNMVEIDNENPTDASADDLTGKVVVIGEYELTIDEISAGDAEHTWKGKGRVEWNPLGTKVMVCVEFDSLKINTDFIVYGGMAKTYTKDKNSNNDIVENLFSDWGIDNYFTDSSIPYSSQIQQTATDAAKGLAAELDLSKYYEYVVVGQNIWNSIGNMNIDELYMPIGLPEEMTKNSPVDIQISTMKFAPTYATMDLIGEFVLPDCDVLKDQILVFGAPRLCISPDRILPESGTIALLADLTITDPDSDFDCTFKAPKDVLNPVDGCYLSWHADTFELMGVDIDMTIPKLKKDVDGVAQDECPVFNVKTSIGDWDDWMVDNVSIDPFQAEDLPGWTFTVQNIVYDHSYYRNSEYMGSFPTGYNTGKSIKAGDIMTWQGLYIKEVSVKMPKALEFGTSGDRRLKIGAKNMFFDDSGTTLEVGAEDILSAETGQAGGWSFSLDEVKLNFVQDTLHHCGFNGTFDVPLLEGKIGYDCQILKVNDLKNSKAGNYAYVFKVQQVDNMSLDFFLATAEFKKELSYLLVEAVPDEKEDELKTRVELLLSGDLSLGGEMMKKEMGNLALDFDLPGIHFSKMRLANCPVWESQFENVKKMQQAKDETKTILELYKGKEINIKDKLYFSTGQWSLASMQKTLGPFELSLDKFDINYEEELLKLGIQGSVTLIEGLDFSASAGITIMAKVSGLSGLTSFDFSKLDIAYVDTKFDQASFNTSFAGMKLSGSLDAKEDKNYGKGFKGTLEFVMVGDLFTAKADGGYFECDDFRWGYFQASVGSAAGIPIPPIALTDISAGFYFNCIRKSDTAVEPQKGIIGVVAGLGIAPAGGGDALLNGTFEATVVYDSEKDRLTTFMLTGDMEAVSGMIKSKATIVYQEDDKDKYFALNVTIDGKADGVGGIGEAVTQLSDKLAAAQKALNSKMEEVVSNVSAGLGVLSDQSETQARPNPGATMPEKPKVGEASMSLDLRITMKENGKKLDKVKWHLYLGQPDEDKRCKFTLVNFSSEIVSVKIGANAYLCLGNELPNNGELPPIPAKIQQYLDGGTHGSGMVSDDINMANNARKAALNEFKAEVYGGVMLGASAWGYIDVDLGLFKGNMGALAGFDVALRNIGSIPCMNIPRTPGINGWYGEGQLYAYLYSKFGIHIDLGFWSDDIDLVDAELGGVMRMGLVNPSYFTGKARAKLRLLAGLVNIDRKFEFECGERCEVFYGNALDKFKLFGDCSIGDTLQSRGWSYENAIDPTLFMRPTLQTEAPIEEHFRVLDETELNRLAANFNGDKEKLKAQASRTFVFKLKSLLLREYDYSKKFISSQSISVVGNNRFSHVLDLLKLNPNRYYVLTAIGQAKEIVEGKEVSPLKWDEAKQKYEQTPWTQTLNYYFMTGDETAMEDCPEDLQKYVALAYPSYYNELKSEQTFDAYIADIKAPNIAFYSDLSKSVFQKGKLVWTLSQGSYSRISKSTRWQRLEEIEAKWLTTDSTCNLTGHIFSSELVKDKKYKLTLNYITSKRVAVRTSLGATIRVVSDTTNIVNWVMNAREGFYHRGVNNEGTSIEYEKPFVGIRLNSINYYQGTPKYSGKGMSYYNKFTVTNAAGNVVPARYADPYTYIAYMSNYALIGGWELTNSKLKLNATTSQSLIYGDKYGIYEGTYDNNYENALTSDYYKIRNMSAIVSPSYEYPLPVMMDGKYSYAQSGTDRAYEFTPAESDKLRAKSLVNDLYNVYYAVDKFDREFRKKLQALFYETDEADIDYADWVQEQMEDNAGLYITASQGNARIEVPYYQMGLLWGSHFNHNYISGRNKITLWGSFKGIPDDWSRPEEEISENIVVGLIGNHPTPLVGVSKVITGIDEDGDYTKSNKVKYIDFVQCQENIKKINVTYYRVNAFNHQRAKYTVVGHIYVTNGPIWPTFTYSISNPSTMTTKTNYTGGLYN
ncbi:MAG: hypothetical protein J6R11_02100, partial [Bacteroidaceae bacterium]|nr:hypothetical protein [Bacteroidaceae bacterium]